MKKKSLINQKLHFCYKWIAFPSKVYYILKKSKPLKYAIGACIIRVLICWTM